MTISVSETVSICPLSHGLTCGFALSPAFLTFSRANLQSARIRHAYDPGGRMSITFRAGRLDPHPEDTHPRLKLGPRLTGALAPPPASADWYSEVAGWPMYLNDQLGDCTCSSTGHIIESASRYGEGDTLEVPQSAILAEYERVGGYVPGDPSTDNGAVIQDVLADWRKTGVGGHKCLVYAQVNISDLEEVRQAIDLFGVADLGITVTQGMMDAFNDGQPWTDASGQSLGGHCVPAVGYDASNVYVVTWGAVQAMSWTCFTQATDEAWIAVTPEWVDMASKTPADPLGVDLYGLGEDLSELTGEANPFPAPAPMPEPEPTPSPAPSPDDLLAELASLVRLVAASADRDISEVMAWLASHGL
jgi:hypothetical protein